MSSPIPSVSVGSGECWLPFVQVLDEIEKVTQSPTAENLEVLEKLLSLYQVNFRSLLTTKAKNPKEREYIKTGVTEGITLRACEAKQPLPLEWVTESLLLSDVLDINEFQALDLLITGESEVMNYPCWSRGLIAVNMYYEGQHALISALHAMVRLTPGLTWGSRVSHKLIDIVKPFLENLYADNLIDKVLDLLPRFEVQKQMDSLDGNLALGDWRHRTEILKHMTGIRIELAQIVFCFAAQERMDWKNTLRILEYLRHLELKRDVKFYKEQILLISCVLFGLDNNMYPDNFDKSYALEFRKYVVDAESKSTFLCLELLEFINLAYFTAVYKLLSDLTINGSSTLSGRSAIGKRMETSSELLGDEEIEFKTDIFSFLKIEIFTNEAAEVNEEEHVMRRFHALFTDFINYMPMKLKDMKVRSEDAAKTVLLYLEQGIARPPHLPVEYESFLECMASFYSLDKELQLAEDFFTTERQSVSISKFTRSLCHDTPAMFVCSTKLMTGLSKSFPAGVFSLIRQNGHNLSLDHFFESILKYLASFGKFASTTGPVFQSDAYQRVVLDSMKVTLSHHEANGIVAYLQLIQGVCSEHSIKMYFADTKRHWIKLALLSTKIRTLPREVRSEMLKAVAGMIPTETVQPETIGSLWEIFYGCNLVETGPGAADFREELEEKETRLESYILCVGFLQLLDALVKARYVSLRNVSGDEGGVGPTQGDRQLLERYVSYVRDEVLLKLAYRTYRSIPERWEMTTLSISILSRLLDEVPVLLVEFLSDNPVVKSVLGMLVECTKVREMSTGNIPHVDLASWEILNLIYQVVIRQDVFLQRAKKVVRSAVLYGMHDLLLSVNLATDRAEYLIALLKFIDKFNPEKHQELSLKILTTILSQHSDSDAHLYAGITSDQKQALILEYTFAQCLSNPSCSIQIKKNILQLLRCSVVHPAPNIGLFLLGIDKKIDFQKAASDKYRPSKTILQCILENCEELPDVFLTILVLLRDERLRDSLLRYLRATQFFVKFYIDSFSTSNMDIRDVGHFLKCVSIDLKYNPQVGPLAHVLVSQTSNKFLNILERVELTLEWPALPRLDFFEKEVLEQAIAGCEYFDRDFKVKLVDVRRLEDMLEEEIQKLISSNKTRMGRGVQLEAKELVEFIRTHNDLRQKEASKLILFECWKQCLEVLLVTPSTLKLAGMDFVTSVLRLIVDKVTNTEGATDVFLRIAGEAVLTLCGVLNTFKEELSESMLNLILTYLCTWTSTESTVAVRVLLYPSILNIVGIMKEQNKSITSRNNFAVIVDALCKDCLLSADTGKISSLYLLGEIIHWSMRSGYGGRVPYSNISQPLLGSKALPSTAFSSKSVMLRKDESFIETEYDDIGGGDTSASMRWQDISVISPVERTPRFLGSPNPSNTTRKLELTFTDQLNSTVLPMDVRDKQYIAPGDWKVTAKDDSYIGFQQKDSSSCVKQASFPAEKFDGFRQSPSLAAKTTVMSYMQAKGLIRHLIAGIKQEDDLGLHDLFSSVSGSTHLRALLIFNAKMHLFSRFARTGGESALMLLEDNIIPHLAEMSALKMATRLNLWNPIVDNLEGGSSLEAKIAKSKMVQRASQVDSLLVSIWSFLLSMDSSLPKNGVLAKQLLSFVQLNKETAVSLLSRCPTDTENNAELPEALCLFTCLLARIGEKLSIKTLLPNDDIFDKVIDTLKKICRKATLTNAQSFVAKDLLQYLYGYATSSFEPETSQKTVSCHPILVSIMSYLELEEECTGLAIGDILRLVQLAAFRIPNWDGPPEILFNLQTICEVGLTFVYLHLEIYMRPPMHSVPAIEMSNEMKRRSEKNDPSQDLQINLTNYMEEVLAKTLGDAFPVRDDAPTLNYVHTILYRIRRLANMSRE